MPIHNDPEGNESKALAELVNFSGMRVLEVGCGDGRLTWQYAIHAAHVTAIDPDYDEIQLAKQDQPDVLKDHVEFIYTDIEDYELKPGMPKFDIVLFTWSLC